MVAVIIHAMSAALMVTGVQTCALPICRANVVAQSPDSLLLGNQQAANRNDCDNGCKNHVTFFHLFIVLNIWLLSFYKKGWFQLKPALWIHFLALISPPDWLGPHSDSDYYYDDFAPNFDSDWDSNYYRCSNSCSSSFSVLKSKCPFVVIFDAANI